MNKRTQIFSPSTPFSQQPNRRGKKQKPKHTEEAWSIYVSVYSNLIRPTWIHSIMTGRITQKKTYQSKPRQRWGQPKSQRRRRVRNGRWLGWWSRRERNPRGPTLASRTALSPGFLSALLPFPFQKPKTLSSGSKQKTKCFQKRDSKNAAF